MSAGFHGFMIASKTCGEKRRDELSKTHGLDDWDKPDIPINIEGWRPLNPVICMMGFKRHRIIFIDNSVGGINCRICHLRNRILS